MNERPASGRGEDGDAADIHADRLLILDFGSQYTQLIARRVREIGAYCEIRPWHTPPAEIHAFAPRALILSGGPDTLTAGQSMRLSPEALPDGIPVLGICYGMQLLAVHCGGAVETAGHREYGRARVRLAQPCPLFDGLATGADAALEVWMSHGDRVTVLPEGWEACAATDNAPIAAMQEPRRRWYGLQFHPEVTHTPQGAEILRRFVCEVAGLQALWTPAGIIDDAIARVRARVGREQVLLALSGGVDSCVTAALLQRAIGEQLLCIFVDNGLLRLAEGDQVMRVLGEEMQVHLVRVNAGERFFSRLRGVADPERKRRIIGETFIEVFEEEAHRHGGIRWLAQGTIYPDVIESATAGSTAHTIKSHHNVGGLPERMKLQLLEPLRELFKDEVRAIGTELGLPPALLQRHPFPGPGLGVRILGEISAEAAAVLRSADAIFIEELQHSGWYQKTAQAFAVFLPVHSVGVTGDARKYAPVIALRAVETTDFMTARHARLPPELLARVTERILNEVRGVSRVVYDISDKPPATIEWE